MGGLFQSFSRADSSTTRKYGGTGLGLAISKRLAELMGGTMAAESAGEGQGATFRFSIRAVPAVVPKIEARRLVGRQDPIAGKRLLVVDDNATNRKILSLQTAKWGAENAAFETPDAALAALADGAAFDLAILDMHMPGMDGVALARRIRSARPGLPMILFSSLGQREAEAEAGLFAAFLAKPLRQSQLFDTLVSQFAADPAPQAPARAPDRPRTDPAMASLHPLRILVAEDNLVNPKLALRLLAQRGHRADLASNGIEALESVARQTYDAVLMDVQMPEMDGLEAACRITADYPADGRPRIEAMTANAVQGDRDMRPRSRHGRLNHQGCTGRRACRGAAGRARARQGGRMTAPVLNPAAYAEFQATMGDDFADELRETFIAEVPGMLAAVHSAAAAGDAEGFRRAAHPIKSNAALFGATALADRAHAMELGGLPAAAPDAIDAHHASADAALRGLLDG